MRNLLKEYFEVKGIKIKTTIVILLTIIYSAINAGVTLLISTIVSNVGNDTAIKCLNVLIVFIVSDSILCYIITRIIRGSNSSVNVNISNKIADTIIDSDFNTFTKYGSGYINTIVNSSENISKGIRYILSFINSLIQFCVIIVSIGIIERRLIIPIILLYMIIIAILKRIFNKMYEYDEKVQDIKHKRNDEIQKVVSGFAEVRSNNTQKFHRDAIHNLNEEYHYTRNKKIIISAGTNMLFDTIDGIITLIAVMYAIIAVPSGLLPSLAMSLVIYAWRLLDPLINMLSLVDEISDIISQYKKYSKFISDADGNKMKNGSIELVSFNDSIEIDNVSFSYEKSDSVLNNITLSIRKGQKIGICGHSGCGKSTLLKLIPRMYDVHSGSIKIDGIDIRDLTRESLINKMGIVHQTNYIFKGTLYDNVVYGVGDNIDREKVIDACKKAYIYDFIMSLPDGFNTDVGPNGLKLSGGQQQRIAIARIILRDPDIIILDEATSALDNEAEKIIQDSFKLFEDKTIITVAHRLSTIKDCDKIFVIGNHQVSESGTHTELLNNDSDYSRMYNCNIN